MSVISSRDFCRSLCDRGSRSGIHRRAFAVYIVGKDYGYQDISHSRRYRSKLPQQQPKTQGKLPQPQKEPREAKAQKKPKPTHKKPTQRKHPKKERKEIAHPSRVIQSVQSTPLTDVLCENQIFFGGVSCVGFLLAFCFSFSVLPVLFAFS